METVLLLAFPVTKQLLLFVQFTLSCYFICGVRRKVCSAKVLHDGRGQDPHSEVRFISLP